MLEPRDALLTRAQAALRLKVSPNLVGMWRLTGKLHVAGHNAKGHPLYRLGDLLEVERATRRSGKSHRKAS